MKIFKPTLKDIPQIQELLKVFVEDGVILKRDDNEVATNIRSYIVASYEDNIIAVGALHIYSTNLAEIRSLAVQEKYQRRKIGQKIVLELEKEAKKLGISQLLTLTYKKEFFEKLGFKEIPKKDVPEQKVWSDCIKCPHFPNCDEISLIKTI